METSLQPSRSALADQVTGSADGRLDASPGNRSRHLPEPLPVVAAPTIGDRIPGALPGRWTLLSDTDAAQHWNVHVATLADCSPFQSYEWGAYHKALGWQPLHYVHVGEDGAVKAMCLGLLRRYPLRTGFVWCVGGPIGDIDAWAGLPDAIRASQNLKRVYFRFRCDRRRRPTDVLRLRRQGFKPSYHTMGSNLSMELDLTPAPDAMLRGFARNWRRSLRQAEAGRLTVRHTVAPDIDRLRAVYAEMEGMKNLPELFSRDKLGSLFQHAGARLVFFQAEDGDGKVVALRGALMIGGRACDYVAASNSEGRRLLASYPLLWAILCHCHAAGVTHYDLGGIDPWEAPGVYAFKRQTGAAELELLGEWDWASSPALQWIGNWAIHRRQNRRKPRSRLRGGLNALWPPAAFDWFSEALIRYPAIG